MPAERVIFYIDGFNLYHGLCERFGKKFLWLNLEALAQRLCQPNEQLIEVNYFTTKSLKNDSRKRQEIYLKALKTLPKVNVIPGKFLKPKRICKITKIKCPSPHEKRTDVSIAVKIISDSYEDRFDIAKVISGDSDFVPIVEKFKIQFKSNKKIFFYFPPKRRSDELRNKSDGGFPIFPGIFRYCQLPDTLMDKNKELIIKPSNWI